MEMFKSTLYMDIYFIEHNSRITAGVVTPDNSIFVPILVSTTEGTLVLDFETGEYGHISGPDNYLQLCSLFVSRDALQLTFLHGDLLGYLKYGVSSDLSGVLLKAQHVLEITDIDLLPCFNRNVDYYTDLRDNSPELPETRMEVNA